MLREPSSHIYLDPQTKVIDPNVLAATDGFALQNAGPIDLPQQNAFESVWL